MKRSDVREWIPGGPLERVDFGDAFSKLAGSIDAFANGEVGTTRAGLGQSKIVRLRADRREAQSSKILDRIRAGRAVNGDADVPRQSGSDAAAAQAAGTGSQ